MLFVDYAIFVYGFKLHPSGDTCHWVAANNLVQFVFLVHDIEWFLQLDALELVFVNYVLVFLLLDIRRV